MRVTDVGKILEARLFKDMVDEGGNVLEAQVGLPVVPILTVIGCEAQMALAIVAATVVTKPDVVAFVGQDKRVSLIGVIHDVFHHVCIESMNKKYGWLRALLWLLELRKLARDAVE